MTTEQGDPIGTETPDTGDVPADPNSSPPEGPFVPDLPDSVNYEGPIGVTGIFNGNVTTGGSYDPLSHSAHRAIDDIVVPGSIGKYPLKMTRYYNSRQQYYAFGAISLSPGWSHEYSWLVWAAGYVRLSLLRVASRISIAERLLEFPKAGRYSLVRRWDVAAC